MVAELQPEDPRTVGRYQLLGRLGSGGMGFVYLGRSPGGRYVAVKVIRAELAGQSDFRIRFAREVAAARTVAMAIKLAPVKLRAFAMVLSPSLAAVPARAPPPEPAWS